MAKLKSDLTFLLTIINFFGSIGILVCGFIYPKSIFHCINIEGDVNTKNITNWKRQYNFNKLKIITDEDSNINLNKTIFLVEEEINIPQKYEDIINSYRKPQKLRELLSIDFGLFSNILYINFLTMYLSFILLFSFIEEINEFEKCLSNGCYWDQYFKVCCCCACGISCCTRCTSFCKKSRDCFEKCVLCQCGCCSGGKDCKCDCKGGKDGAVLYLCIILLALLIIIGFFYSLFFFLKICGKHISRIVSLIINSIVNLSIVIICLFLLEEKKITIYIIISISGFIFISNILALLFVNCCECCRYDDYSDPISDFNMNKGIQENNKNDITPYEDKSGKDIITPLVDL